MRPDGTYVPPPPANSKASYATMLFVRADIVKNAGGCMAKAVTIATRYAAVRRQTAPAPGKREVQVRRCRRRRPQDARSDGNPSKPLKPAAAASLMTRWQCVRE